MIVWNILLTNQAEADLRGIYEYIAFELLQSGTAQKLTRRIIAHISKLSHMPQGYALYQKEPWKSRGLRRINDGNYAIFFVPIKSKQTVAVIRIIYSGRDIERILDDMPNEISLNRPNSETIAALQEIADMRSGKIPKQTASVADFVKEMGE